MTSGDVLGRGVRDDDVVPGDRPDAQGLGSSAADSSDGARPADAIEATILLVYGFAVAGGSVLRTLSRRVVGETEVDSRPLPVPAATRSISRTLPVAMLGALLAANRGARRRVEALSGPLRDAAQAVGIDALADAVRRPVLGMLRPWYEQGLRHRQVSTDLTEAVVREGVGGATDGIVGLIDIDSIVAGVDIDGIVSRLEISNIVLQSTGGIMGDSLGYARGVGRGADRRVQAIVDRLIRRRSEIAAPATPDPSAAGPRP